MPSLTERMLLNCDLSVINRQRSECVGHLANNPGCSWGLQNEALYGTRQGHFMKLRYQIIRFNLFFNSFVVLIRTHLRFVVKLQMHILLLNLEDLYLLLIWYVCGGGGKVRSHDLLINVYMCSQLWETYSWLCEPIRIETVDLCLQ